MSTFASLYRGLLCFSVLTYFSKARVFHTAIESNQLLQYGHAYQLNNRANIKTMDARVHVLRNGAKRKQSHLRTIVQRNGTLTFY